MKAREKLIMLTVFTAAWIGLWMSGKEDPSEKYVTWEIAVFAFTLVVCFVQFVRYSSQYVQERDRDKLRKLLRNRDARTDS